MTIKEKTAGFPGLNDEIFSKALTIFEFFIDKSKNLTYNRTMKCCLKQAVFPLVY